LHVITAVTPIAQAGSRGAALRSAVSVLFMLLLLLLLLLQWAGVLMTENGPGS
jgi:hypothetical protein